MLHLLCPAFLSSSSSPAFGFLQRPFTVKYTEGQLRRTHKTLDMWKEAIPVDLVKRIQQIQKESSMGVLTDEEMEVLREKLASDLIKRLDELKAAGNESQQQYQALQQWRKKKLEEIRIREQKARAEGAKSELQQEAQAAEGLRHLLVLGWSSLLEDIGWEEPDANEGEEIPTDSEIDSEIVPGRTPRPECKTEVHTDYDGTAVRWGLTFHVESAADCCQACLDQAKWAKGDQLKCNIWVYCPQEAGCYSPDIYEHRHQECWLKEAKQPRLNFKGKYSLEYRRSHPTAPVVVPWVSGAIGSFSS